MKMESYGVDVVCGGQRHAIKAIAEKSPASRKRVNPRNTTATTRSVRGRRELFTQATSALRGVTKNPFRAVGKAYVDAHRDVRQIHVVKMCTRQ